MKTTFLLHGGRIKLKDVRNDNYFRELTKNLVNGDTVLFIGFARRDEKDRKATYELEKLLIQNQAKVNIQIEYATHDNFIKQVKSARAIHITGGETPELVMDIQKYPEFIDLIKGKVVGGSSAGACLFSKYYFYSNELEVLEGLGTLPIRMRVHSDNAEFGDVQSSIDLLKKYPEELELILIEECAWIKVEVDL